MMRIRRWSIVIAAGIWLASSACALDPSKAISQYVQDYWDSDKGFVGGAVYAICQSGDGYLWIGTERGLVRFDGFAFKLIQRPIPNAPALGAVRGLVSDAEGNLWIRPDGARLLLYRDGHFEDAVARYGLLEETAFTAMSVDSRGNLLLWGIKNRTLRFQAGQFKSLPESAGLPGIVISLAAGSDGRLWMGTRDIGLFSTDQGHLIGMSGRLALTSVNALLSADDRGLWIGTDAGLYKQMGATLERPAQTLQLAKLQVLSLAKDHHGTVWVGTARGLVRMESGQGTSAEFLNRKSGMEVTAVYEDRDGDIWYGGLHGIGRLRDGTFTKYSLAQGLPAENNGPVYIDGDGRTWFAPVSGGVFWLKNGKTGHVSASGLDKDVVYSISGGDGEIWLGREHGGLTRLTKRGDSFSAQTYTQSDGLAQNSVYSVHRNHNGTVWAGTVSGGLSILSGRSFTNYSVANGPRSNAVFSIVEGHDGTMWFASPSGLESFSRGIWKNFSAADGLPSSNVRTMFEDSHQSLWIATSAGLAVLEGGHVEPLHALADSLHEEILGITEDENGFLWIVTSDHVLKVNRDLLLQGTIRESDVISYGVGDGLPGVEGVSRDRSATSDGNGRIWLSLVRGLASTDQSVGAGHAVSVAARIESIEGGGVQKSPAEAAKFAAGTQTVALDFASTNLSSPERIRFRYRLEGSVRGWSDDVQSRRVVYTNLGPGSYRFHIVASNGNGVWNGPETVVTFVIEPAFWQTWWFRILCMLVGGLMLFAAYRWRLATLTNRLNERFNDRLAERTRIAQDLHDTLLQGVLSASLQLDLVEDQTPSESPTKSPLKRILELLKHVTEEGRNTLRGLRSSDQHDLNIEAALSRLRQEFAVDEHLSYRVVVYGGPQPLHPAVRDDVYRIAREAVVNAFLHAKAANIEVEVEYARRYFRISVRDDGCGIDPLVLRAGRDGHWGLPGMRERSESIGSNLKLRSRVGAGTELELVVPGTIAFGGESSRSPWKWLGQPNRAISRVSESKERKHTET